MRFDLASFEFLPTRGYNDFVHWHLAEDEQQATNQSWKQISTIYGVNNVDKP